MHENDLSLARNLAQESANRASYLRSLTTRNVLFGSATVAAGAGLGLAAMIWAWNQGVDPDALKQALADLPPIKVETSGQVTMKDGVVAMKDGTVSLEDGAVVGIDPEATVALADGGKVSVDGTVALEPGATVAVSGGIGGTSARPDVSSQPAKTEDGKAIMRSVTVFSTIDVGRDQIVTGWRYPNGKASSPSSQYCYYATPNADGTLKQIIVGRRRQSKRSGPQAVAQLRRRVCEMPVVEWSGVMASEENEDNKESPYTMAPTAYYPMVQMIVERTAREVSNADGSVADMFWIISHVMVDMVRRYCRPGTELEHLEWQTDRMLSVLRSYLGQDKASEGEQPQPTTSEVGRA